jgi:hypothetical protein
LKQCDKRTNFTDIENARKGKLKTAIVKLTKEAEATGRKDND